MKVLLLCNYRPDGQQSMLRFGDLLARALASRGVEVLVISPAARLGSCFPQAASSHPGRWLGYVDKYLLFQRDLRRILHSLSGDLETVVHVVDHSNAVYVPAASALPWVVTCHDLLAVRGALGEDTDCPASSLGRRLQHRVRKGLVRSNAVACDSTNTREDLDRVVPRPSSAQSRPVIFLPLNHPYHPRALTTAGILPGLPPSQPFLLHVGSNLARKNKLGVLRVFLRLAAGGWTGSLVFCGAELPLEIRAIAFEAGLMERIHAVPCASNEQLNTLYSRAHVLLFPSRGEGFGWPIIEAQACDCPVICSDRTSLPEIGGNAALVHALDDETGMATSVLKLGDAGFRAEVIGRGRENLTRFSTESMLDAYMGLYQSLLNARSDQS